ncbi:glycine/D-amino acid oxidase-like deaminating enzyme [Chitinophaga skermanii]|uniref:Glycine/D-amino acid oxidase-like deaminating enzyme n=1 Tax=Chitinophaga skermanii TaxID=331697 RepID=A0A327QAL0_9BACT|nr:FAD-dependent oxidoreductase [Chitinophaga skermanii]RAJ00253.1 glycine/D-amino acid oxidase-like deaminating enzyme [Chitinophaga skermanii]
MLSYWEEQYLLDYDRIIVGSGITGLSTAISLKDRHPSMRILVIERGILPTGASTKNAGFACIGSFTEILADLKSMPEEAMLKIVALRLKGLNILTKRLPILKEQCLQYGSYELISEEELSLLDQLSSINTTLKSILPGDAFTIDNGKISEFGFHPQYTKALIRNNFEGELNTGLMMRSLLDEAIKKGVEIKTGCTVTQFEETGSQVLVTVETLNGQTITFRAQQMAICTNAFANLLVPGLDIAPGRGQVLITKPIPGLRFKGIFHFDEGYYYFRELDGRVLFGGGRNLDFEGETTREIALNERLQQNLEEKLQQVIIPNTPYEIDRRWAGIMAFGKDKQPILQRYSPAIVIGARLGGMGVAIGSALGEQLAAWLE